MPVFIPGNVQQIGIFPNRVAYTSSGSWTVPAGVTLARVRLIGGGFAATASQANGRNGMGDDGWERDEIVTVTPGGTVPVVVGAVGGNSSVAGITAAGGAAQSESFLSGSTAQGQQPSRNRREARAGSVSGGVYGLGSVGGAGATAGVVEIWY